MEMSLFTFKELWAVDCNEGFDSFSSKSLDFGNLDNDSSGKIKFVLGSFSGVLRIIGSPNTSPSDKDVESSQDISNRVVILAELNLGSPILQVEADVFVSGSDKINLAILHPQKLAVYSVSKLPGQVEHGSQYKVTLLYQHQLKRHAFNMCCGSFGHGMPDSDSDDTSSARKTNRRFLCVQSLDGTLSFFEQELFTFSRYLPGFLLPGQLAYVPSWDSFLTITSWNLICFKYTNLAMAKDDPYQQQFQDTTIGKRLTADWIFSIGEECIGDIQVLSTNDSASTKVVVCTFRNLFCVGEGGHLIWSKRLDYQISYYHSFLLPVAKGEFECVTITGSSNEPHTCYIYNKTSLRWAAKLPFSPIHLSRAVLKNMNGEIIALSSDGKLVVGCLGTVPSLFVAPPVQSRDLDYESAESELHDLRKAIAASGEQNVVSSKDNTVEIKLEFEGQKTKWIESTGLEVISLIGVVKLVCHLKVNDVRVTISTRKPIVCSPESVFVGDIIGRHSYPVEFYMENEGTPSDLQTDIFVFYVQDSGEPHFVQKCGIKIPLFIVAKSHHQLEKEADVKFTFSLNKPVITLQTLYNDFQWNLDGNPAGISFHLFSGEKVSLLTSTKTSTETSSKYRIQSNTLAAIYLFYHDFVERLQRKFGREKSDLIIEPQGYENETPLLAEYFGEIDAHILRRRRDIQIKDELSDRAAQLRAIQRRLLIRFRDKNPIPLTQLEILFDGSLEQVGDCLNFMEENDLEKQKSECRLSGATKLLLELVLARQDQSVEDISLLSSALSPYVWNFTEDYGWEESVYTGLTYIKSQVIVNQTFSNLDPTKLKKAIKAALDKARKGTVSKKVPDSLRNQEQEIRPETEKLIGNEIVERMTSARGRTTRRRNPTLASIPEPNEEENSTRPSDSITGNHAYQQNQEEYNSRLSLNDGILGDIAIEDTPTIETMKQRVKNEMGLKGQGDLDDEGFW